MTRRRISVIGGLFVAAVALVWLPYRIHIQEYAADAYFISLSILLPLCLLAGAAFAAIGAPVRVRGAKG
jgi:hypothetical protein